MLYKFVLYYYNWWFLHPLRLVWFFLRAPLFQFFLSRRAKPVLWAGGTDPGLSTEVSPPLRRSRTPVSPSMVWPLSSGRSVHSPELPPCARPHGVSSSVSALPTTDKKGPVGNPQAAIRGPLLHVAFSFLVLQSPTGSSYFCRPQLCSLHPPRRETVGVCWGCTSLLRVGRVLPGRLMERRWHSLYEFPFPLGTRTVLPVAKSKTTGPYILSSFI